MRFYQTIKQLPEVQSVSDKEMNRIWRDYHGSRVSSRVILSFFSTMLLGATGASVEGILGFGSGIGGLMGALIGWEIFTHVRISDIQSRIGKGEIQLTH